MRNNPELFLILVPPIFRCAVTFTPCLFLFIFVRFSFPVIIPRKQTHQTGWNTHTHTQKNACKWKIWFNSWTHKASSGIGYNLNASDHSSAPVLSSRLPFWGLQSTKSQWSGALFNMKIQGFLYSQIKTFCILKLILNQINVVESDYFLAGPNFRPLECTLISDLYPLWVLLTLNSWGRCPLVLIWNSTPLTCQYPEKGSEAKPDLREQIQLFQRRKQWQ